MTPTYPGVFVNELSRSAQTIAGVPTSITAFVGSTSRGRKYRPVHVSNVSEFETRCGGLASGHELGYSVRQFFLNGGGEAWIVPVPPNVTVQRYVRGINALDAVNIFNLLVLPGITDFAILNAAADYCAKRRAFFIVDSPESAKTPADMGQIMDSNALPKNRNGAVYYPRIIVTDINGQLRQIAPGGTIAGVIARIDATRGVWKAPAGKDVTLAGVTGLAYSLTNAENGPLNTKGINCLRVFPGPGPVVWGSRTLEGDDLLASEWKYIPVRRLSLFIEESIYRGMQWVVFEPNDEPLWGKIRMSVTAFLHDLFIKGAFQGATPQQAFFVKCDHETTTANDMAHGVVRLVVGFAPLKPAEFIIIRFELTARIG